MADILVQTNPPSTFFKTLGTMIFGAVVGGTAVYLLHRVQEMEPGAPRARLQAARKALTQDDAVRAQEGGWYVKLFNYAPGHPDRRLKGLEGPFRTKNEAVHVEAHQRAIWFTKVQFFRTAPRI